MKTYYIEIECDGVKNDTNFIVLAENFANASEKAYSYLETESKKKVNKGVVLDICDITLINKITEVKNISQTSYIEPTFKK